MLGLGKVLASAMNCKYVLGLIFLGLVAGCSKKEETPTPPQSQPAASAAPAPATSANKSALDATPLEQAATNARGAINSLTTNAAQFTTATASGIIPNASIPTGGTVKPPPQATPAIPGTVDAAPAKTTAPLSLANLSTDQLTQGLKEALGNGLQHAVAELGRPGGFLTNLDVKITLPDKLQPVDKALRALGQGQLVDQCVTTMNQAAEQAVPTAADVFANSLKNMNVADAKGILNGPADAATQYFRRATEAELTQKFQPIIQQSMTKCGATAAYEQLLDKARSANPFFNNPSLDPNAYVTGKAMDGLFKMVAAEEKRIRENPVARSTDLLKSVFGSIEK